VCIILCHFNDSNVLILFFTIVFENDLFFLYFLVVIFNNVFFLCFLAVIFNNGLFVRTFLWIVLLKWGFVFIHDGDPRTPFEHGPTISHNGLMFCRCHGLQPSYYAVWHWQIGPLLSRDLSSSGERHKKYPPWALPIAFSAIAPVDLFLFALVALLLSKKCA
jgi:hypothetical protein